MTEEPSANGSRNALTSTSAPLSGASSKDGVFGAWLAASRDEAQDSGADVDGCLVYTSGRGG